MPNAFPTRPAKPSEEGYILLGVMILLALFILAMAVAAPKVAADIQRDRDLETMRRGKQYIRAIQLYYKKFNAYPPKVDALVKTNEIRFLRRRYIDPTTGKDDWKPILFGQNKTPMAMGFFGKPLGGTGMGGNAIAGIGPGGLGSALGSGTGTTDGSPFPGSDNSSTTSNAGSAISAAGTAPPAGTGGSTSSTDSGTGSPATSGQTFGGAGIIGFSPASPKQSIYVYKKKNHYNEWEFLYSPLSDQQVITGGNTNLPSNQPGQQNQQLSPNPSPNPSPSPAPSPSPQQ